MALPPRGVVRPLAPSEKSNNRHIGKGIKFLGFTFRLVKTGVVVKIVTPNNIKSERKKLKRMVNKAKRGEMTKQKIDKCYKSWKVHVEKGNGQILRIVMEVIAWLF